MKWFILAFLFYVCAVSAKERIKANDTVPQAKALESVQQDTASGTTVEKLDQKQSVASQARAVESAQTQNAGLQTTATSIDSKKTSTSQKAKTSKLTQSENNALLSQTQSNIKKPKNIALQTRTVELAKTQSTTSQAATVQSVKKQNTVSQTGVAKPKAENTVSRTTNVKSEQKQRTASQVTVVRSAQTQNANSRNTRKEKPAQAQSVASLLQAQSKTKKLQAKIGKKTKPKIQRRASKAKKSNTRRVTQVSDAELNQYVNSVTRLLDELPSVCQGNIPLIQKVKNFQNKLTLIRQRVRQIKEDFIINSPSLHSYIHTLNFYLNESKEFRYRRPPENTEELKEYVSGLALSFQYMYQLAFNIPEETPMNRFPRGWGRSIGTALHCLDNHR